MATSRPKWELKIRISWGVRAIFTGASMTTLRTLERMGVLTLSKREVYRRRKHSGAGAHHHPGLPRPGPLPLIAPLSGR